MLTGKHSQANSRVESVQYIRSGKHSQLSRSVKISRIVVLTFLDVVPVDLNVVVSVWSALFVPETYGKISRENCFEY